MSRPKLVGSSTCSFQLKFVWEKLKPLVTPATTEFATTNSDRSLELTESLLLIGANLDFGNGTRWQFLTEVLTVRNPLSIAWVRVSAFFFFIFAHLALNIVSVRM